MNYFNSEYKVKDLIYILKNYNPEAYVVGVFDSVGYGMKGIGFGGADGCSEKTCDDVTFHFTEDGHENE